MSAPAPTPSLERFIRDVPDFPRPGILFKDITPLLADPTALAETIRLLAERAERPEAVVAIESRGFVFGTGLALHWRVPFVPVRKVGKLPGRTVRERYALEYGEDAVEIHADALAAGQRVVVVDDLIATGGTAAAAVRLVEQLGGRVAAILFVIELVGLGGRERLTGHRVEALLRYSETGPEPDEARVLDRMARALRTAIETLKADSGTVHLKDGERAVLRLAASEGIPEAVLDVVREVPWGKGMAGLAAERAAPVDACNLQTTTSSDVRPGARATGLQGALVVPILRGDAVMGTIGVGCRVERTFTPDETEWLMQLGRSVASELEH